MAVSLGQVKKLAFVGVFLAILVLHYNRERSQRTKPHFANSKLGSEILWES